MPRPSPEESQFWSLKCPLIRLHKTYLGCSPGRSPDIETMASDEETIHPRVVSHRGLQLHRDPILGVLVLDDGQPQRVGPLVAGHGLHHLKVRRAELSRLVGLHQAGQHRQHAVGVDYRVRAGPDRRIFKIVIFNSLLTKHPQQAGPRTLLLAPSSSTSTPKYLPESVNVLEVGKAR